MNLQDMFLYELKAYFDGQCNRVRHASTLSNYGIKLHKQRLDRLGYQLGYVIENRVGQNPYNSEHCSDAMFRTSFNSTPIILSTYYIRNGETVRYAKEDKKFSTYIEDLAEGRTTLGEYDVLNCPNCGMAGTVSDFRDGCSSCGTHFEMSDVYPSVGTYFFMDNYFAGGRDTSTVSGKISTGIDAYKKAFKLFTKIPTVIDTARTISIFGSWKEYQEFMRPYRPDFSYVHFSNAVISMITMMVYSDEPWDLPFNKTGINYVIAPDLIDFTIEGFGLNRGAYSINGNIASVTVTLFVTSMYNSDGKVKKVSEKFEATFVRDISKPIHQGFSFTRINCPVCGSVFNVMDGKFCPACGNEYNLNNEEWVMVAISRG